MGASLTVAAPEIAMTSAAKQTVPDVPGTLVSDDQAYALKQKVARICGLNNLKFPGAQPVSFSRASLQMLKEEE